jgi:mono/diheme cytochrome c family protein
MNPAPPDEPKPDAPIDSVTALHVPHMEAMNEPTMVTVAGDPVDDAPGAGGQDTVQAMHGILMREHAEPRDGFEPVPVWVMAVFGGLLMWGGYYVGSGSGDFRRDVYDTSELRFAGLPVDPDNPPPDPDPKTVAELLEIGRARYQAVCIACHKGEGEGDPAQKAPPLKGSEWVTGPEASPARLVRIVLYGLHQPITVGGQTYDGQMPPQGVALKDYEIAAALTYVRNSFGHKADTDDARPTITPALVKAAREKEKKRGPYTMAELKAIPLDYRDAPPAEKK